MGKRIAENHRALVADLAEKGFQMPSIGGQVAGGNAAMDPVDLLDEMLEFVNEFCDPDKAHRISMDVGPDGLARGWIVAPVEPAAKVERGS